MIMEKEQIPVSALAGMDMRDSRTKNKTLYRVLFLLNRFTVTPNILKKGIGKSSSPCVTKWQLSLQDSGNHVF